MSIRSKLSFLLFFIVIASECFAASFDCEKATTPAEKMICGDNKLSSFDDELNSAYKSALDSATDKQALKESQRKWIKEERCKCQDPQCMVDVYTKRINELKASTSHDTKNLSGNNAPKKVGEITKFSNLNELGKKYPPYPDVWSIEMLVHGIGPGIGLLAKLADGDYFISYSKEREREYGPVKNAWIKFFAQESKEIDNFESVKIEKKLRDEKREIEWVFLPVITFDDGSSITFNTGAGKCENPYDSFLIKKDKTGKITADKYLLYLYNKPVKTYINTMCERNWDYDKDYYFKKVENITGGYLIPLEDDTFLVVTYGPESIVVLRFDKDFNTKSDLMGKNIFLIDGETVGNLFHRKDIAPGDEGSSDVLYEYLSKLKKEK
jgi:uncharacterized protein